MCEPTTFAALTAASSLASVGISAASAFSKQGAVATNYDQTIANANRALAQNYNSIQTRQQQEADKAQSESFDVARQMAEVKGRANASAGEAGVGGVSFANLMSDYEAREGRARGNIDYNYATTQQDLTNQAEASRTKAQSIISSTVKPDPMAPWLAVGGSAIKAGLKIYDAFDDRGSKPGKGQDIDSEIASWSQYH